LQEYFVPVDSIMAFMTRMRRVLQAHEVNAVNVSIRHALPDPGTYLAWAPNEVFAYVLYYKQRTDPASRREVWRWTRELIDAAVASGGRYYLPYQPVATPAQVTAAYPRAQALIGVSTAIEYGLKGLYENTIGRLSELNFPEGGTAEDKYAAKVARDYAKLIATKGWYEFGFMNAFKGLWTQVPMTGPGFARKWER